MTIDTKRLASDPGYWAECGAPEEATHYTPETDNNKAVWWIGAPQRYAGKLCKLAGSDSDRWTEERADDDEVAGAIPRPTKPAAPEWDGEGLPPEGVDKCECWHTGPDGVLKWTECDVIGPYGDYVICAPNGGGFFGFDAHELRPIRTKEQRDRDEAVDAALSLDEYPGGKEGVGGLMSRRGFCEKLYDAGMLRRPKDA